MNNHKVKFAILKFVPDQMRDEPVNVGIIATVNGKTEHRFLDANRVTVATINSKMIDSLSTGLALARSSLERNEDRELEDLRKIYCGRLRLSDIHGGLTEDVSRYIDKQFERYVERERFEEVAFAYGSARPHPIKTVSNRKKELTTRIEEALIGSGLGLSIAKTKGVWVKGDVEDHRFDFGFRNGQVVIIEAIALPPNEKTALKNAKIKAEDMRDASLGLRSRKESPRFISVVSFDPTLRSDNEHRVKAILEREAEVVDVESVDSRLSDLSSEHLVPLAAMRA